MQNDVTHNDVSPPMPIFEVEPEFTEEARQAKVSGIVTVHMTVDENGKPTNLSVRHGLGYGLDEKAIEAVNQYKFKPARKGDKPVAFEVNVEVNFQNF